MDRRSHSGHQSLAGENIGQTDRLETQRRRQIDVGIEIGMGGLAALHRRLDPRLGRQYVGTPRQKIGRQVLRARKRVLHHGRGPVDIRISLAPCSDQRRDGMDRHVALRFRAAHFDARHGQQRLGLFQRRLIFKPRISPGLASDPEWSAARRRSDGRCRYFARPEAARHMTGRTCRPAPAVRHSSSSIAARLSASGAGRSVRPACPRNPVTSGSGPRYHPPTARNRRRVWDRDSHC